MLSFLYIVILYKVNGKAAFRDTRILEIRDNSILDIQ